MSESPALLQTEYEQGHLGFKCDFAQFVYSCWWTCYF